MAEERAIIWRFIGDPRSLAKATTKAKGDLKDVDRSARRASGGFGDLKKAAGALGVTFAGAKVADFASDAVQAAISAEESASKLDAVFGDVATPAVEEFAEKAGVAMAQSQDMFATLGNLTQAQGFSRDAAADFSEKVADLAGDLASFNDQDPAEVFRKLGLAMVTTERESLKPLGIAISETEVKQRALNIAVADGRDEASKMDRALASYEIAMEQAGGAVGDLDRTSESLANKQRRLTARFEDAKVAIGRELLPVFEDLVGAAEDAVPAFVKAGQAIGIMAREGARWLNPLGERVEGAGSAFDDLTDIVAGGLSVMNDAFIRAIPGMNSTMETAIRVWDELGEGALDTGAIVEENLRGWIPLSSQVESAIDRANRNIALSQNDVTRAIEGTIAAEQRWSESEARAQIARDYEILTAAIGVAGSRQGAEELIVRQGGNLPTRYGGSGRTSDQIREDDRIGNSGVIP